MKEQTPQEREQLSYKKNKEAIEKKVYQKVVESLITPAQTMHINCFSLDFSLVSLTVNLLAKFKLKLFDKNIFLKINSDKPLRSEQLMLPITVSLISSYFNIKYFTIFPR